jgi:hypothetical protein
VTKLILLYSKQAIYNPNRRQINEKSAAFIRGRRLFEGGVYLSKMGKLGSVPVLRTRRLECLLMTIFKLMYVAIFVPNLKLNIQGATVC